MPKVASPWRVRKVGSQRGGNRQTGGRKEEIKKSLFLASLLEEADNAKPVEERLRQKEVRSPAARWKKYKKLLLRSAGRENKTGKRSEIFLFLGNVPCQFVSPLHISLKALFALGRTLA